MNEKLVGKSKRLEVLLWSIALPGFGQLLNKKYIKGVIFILLEFIINVKGNFNVIIIDSFLGQTYKALLETNYLWLMFYPCLYFFAIWDAYKDAGGGKAPFAYLPLVFAAYMTTVGIIYSSVFSVGGIFIGPVWLPMLCMPIGLLIGAIIRWFILHNKSV